MTIIYMAHPNVGRGFRCLKDPFFFADSRFLKNEGWIVAMVMVMGLALVVYSLAEKKLREALESENETIPAQKNDPTKETNVETSLSGI